MNKMVKRKYNCAICLLLSVLFFAFSININSQFFKVSAEDTTLFSDDFSSGLDKWTVPSGEKWTVKSEEGGNMYLNVTGQSKDNILVKDTASLEWEKYSVSLDLKVDAQDAGGVIFSNDSENNMYYAKLWTSSTDLKMYYQLYYYYAGTYKGPVNGAQPIVIDNWKVDEWNNILIKNNKGLIEFYCNNNLVNSFIAIDAQTFKKGRIGFRNTAGTANIDNVTVKSLKATVDVTSPDESNNITNLPFTVQGTSKDAAKIVVSADGKADIEITPETDGTWSCPLDGFKNGDLTVTVKALDTEDQVENSVVKNYTVNVAPKDVKAYFQDATKVNVDDSVKITFDTLMNETTLTSDNIKLYDSQNSIVAATCTPSNDKMSVLVKPDADLNYKETYKVQIGDGVLDCNDNKVSASNREFTFTTGKNISIDPLEFENGEERISLNGTWKFKTDSTKVGETEKWFDVGISTDDWDNMRVPDCWDVHDEYLNYRGTAWYVKTVDVPKKYEDYPARIYINGANFKAKVWVNGHLVGSHANGYMGFYCDLKDYLVYGGENTIAVSINNEYHVGAWWQYGGITQGADLVFNNAVYSTYQHITAIPTIIQGNTKTAGETSLNVKVNLTNSFKEDKNITISSKIYDNKTKELVYENNLSASKTISANDTGIIEYTVNVPANVFKLWDFENPNLYYMETQIIDNGIVNQVITDRFGVRKISVDSDHFYINDVSVRLVGQNRVWDDRVYGGAEPIEVIKRDFDDLKQMGTNCFRFNDGPSSIELLDYADEIGILDFADTMLWGSGEKMDNPENWEEVKEWQRELVERDYNHPCIIGWSIGCEINDCNSDVKEYMRKMVEYIKTELDPNRLVISDMHENQVNQVITQNDPTISGIQYCDVVCYNCYGSKNSHAYAGQRLHEVFNKPVFNLEYGNGGTGFTSDDPNKGIFKPAGITDSMKDVTSIVMSATWTYNDYRSNYYNSPASQSRPWGIVDLWRNKKVGYYDQKNTHSPIHYFNVVNNNDELKPGTNVITTMTIAPRPENYIPHYTIEGYKAKWELYNTDNNLVDSGLIDLPTLDPGDEAFVASVPWTVDNKGAMRMRVTVISSLNYEVYENSFYYNAPVNAPEITDTVNSKTAFRVKFSEVGGSTRTVIKYGTSNDPTSADYLNKSTSGTINDFEDVTGLTNGQTYYYAVCAKNDAGEGPLSEVKKVTLNGENSMMPAKIWRTEPTINGFYVGFSVDNASSSANKETATIKYGTESGNYTNEVTFPVTTGAYEITNLEAGKKYYYRMMRSTASGSSDWSEERCVTTKKLPEIANTNNIYMAIPEMPTIKGISTNDTSVAVTFDTISGTTGYTFEYGSSADNLNKTITCDRANVEQFTFSGIDTSKTFYVRMRADGRNGSSAYTDIMAVNPVKANTADAVASSISDNELNFMPETVNDTTNLNIVNGTSNAIKATISYDLPSKFTIENAPALIDVNPNSHEIIPLKVMRSSESTAGQNTIKIKVTINGEDTTYTVIINNVVAESVYSDDYSATLSSNYIVSSGTFATDDGKLTANCVSGTTAALATLNNITGSDYYVSCTITDVKGLTGNYGYGGGIAFRYTDAKHFYQLKVNKDDSGQYLILGKFNNGFSIIDKYTININDVHNISVNVVGDKITCYYNGKEVISVTDSDLATGTVGYRFFGSSQKVDNLNIFKSIQ